MSSSHSSGQPADDPCTTLSLPFEPPSVRVARRSMCAQLERLGFARPFVDDAELVLAELAANGIDHGRPNPHGQIDISWCIERDVVRISVCDSGEAADITALPFDQDSERGRGLAIVEHLCDSWRVEVDDGLRVTAELRHEQSLEPA